MSKTLHVKRALLSTVFLTIIFIVSTSSSLRPSFQTINDVAWLIGKWERTNVKVGTKAFEYWEKESESSLRGIGFSMRGADTTFVEKLKIEQREGTFYYVADVRENTEPIYFKFTKLSEYGFISENPEHDFPKMISYELRDGQMTATISDGGDKKASFIFKKMD